MRRERSGAGGSGRTGRHRQTAADRQTLRRGRAAVLRRRGREIGRASRRSLLARSLTMAATEGDDDRDDGDDGEKQKREAQMELDIILESRRRSTGRLALLPHSDFTN